MAISTVGATSVFVEVDERTSNLDPGLVGPIITERTRAILPVHLYGQPAAMAQVLAVARRHVLRVVEDCAQSFGARYAGDCPGCEGAHYDGALRSRLTGAMTGTLGDVGTYSFFPSKILGAFGDGGADKCRNERLDYNSRLDALQAAGSS